jgi:hypothetical protein
VNELAERLIQSQNNPKEKVSIIDINQTLSFFQSLEAQKGVSYPAVWKRYEQLILSSHVNELDPKNLAMLANKYSHVKQGSLAFWVALDKCFSRHSSQMGLQDYTSIIHSFSLIGVLEKEKFLQAALALLSRQDVASSINPIDLSQLASTANAQNLVLQDDPSAYKFWQRLCELTLEVMTDK